MSRAVDAVRVVLEFWRDVRADPEAWAGFKRVAWCLLGWVVLPAVVIVAGTVLLAVTL